MEPRANRQFSREPGTLIPCCQRAISGNSEGFGNQTAARKAATDSSPLRRMKACLSHSKRVECLFVPALRSRRISPEQHRAAYLICRDPVARKVVLKYRRRKRKRRVQTLERRQHLVFLGSSCLSPLLRRLVLRFFLETNKRKQVSAVSPALQSSERHSPLPAGANFLSSTQKG